MTLGRNPFIGDIRTDKMQYVQRQSKCKSTRMEDRVINKHQHGNAHFRAGWNNSRILGGYRNSGVNFPRKLKYRTADVLDVELEGRDLAGHGTAVTPMLSDSHPPPDLQAFSMRHHEQLDQAP